MNWDAIGAVGEVVGATAVVLSLLYLGVQIRIQNAESRAAAMHDFYAGWRESSAPFSDAALAEIFVKANANFDSLTEPERLRIWGSLQGIIRLFEEAFFQHQQKRLNPGLWDAINRQYSSLFSTPVYKKYWEMRRAWYHEEFQQHVDGMGPNEYQL